MSKSDESAREVEVLRGRLSRLSAAILHTNASLDLSTVLREAVGSARTLTGARYGAITTVDTAGEIEDHVYSGFSPQEIQHLSGWPDGYRLFEHLRDLSGPVRFNDLIAYVSALGLSPEPMLSKSFQGTPMRHHGEHVGNIFLAEKEGGEAFTQEDEEVLVLFAAQAASAIGNARTHRDEQRARANLEALIETTPVGVAVFDARTGTPVSFNREAMRIMETLCMPGHPPEQLLDSIICRRADGREIAFGDFLLALQQAEMGRAEEVVLAAPDGRKLRALIYATRNRSADGEVETMVITLQDLAPLEHFERLRAELFGIVSHELRAPLAAIKGSTTTVLDSARGVDPELAQFFRIIDAQANHMDRLISDLLDAERIHAGMLSVRPEPTDLAALVDQARMTFLSGGGRHAVIVKLAPELPRVMADRPRIVQVLTNLLSNAARHSPATSPIQVSAERDATHVAIAVADKGRGVPPELLPMLFRKHADQEGGLAGSRLGLAICKRLVEAHGGRIRADSDGPGRGTRVTFTLQVTGEADVDPAGVSAGSNARDKERAHVLVVDDDPQTLRFVRDALDSAGYVPVVTGDHVDLARVIATENPQLVLLDLMLPGTNGLELMETIPELRELPVIFISGYGRGETIAKAFELGAADYLVKPFSAPELTARVRAALRKHTEPEPFVLGDLVIHYPERRVTVAGRPVHLTATEYELLRALSIDAGRVLTHEALLRQVWNGREHADVQHLRTFVRKLRRKLGKDAANPAWIINEHGVGYRMRRPSLKPPPPG